MVGDTYTFTRNLFTSKCTANKCIHKSLNMKKCITQETTNSVFIHSIQMQNVVLNAFMYNGVMIISCNHNNSYAVHC